MGAWAGGAVEDEAGVWVSMVGCGCEWRTWVLNQWALVACWSCCCCGCMALVFGAGLAGDCCFGVGILCCGVGRWGLSGSSSLWEGLQCCGVAVFCGTLWWILNRPEKVVCGRGAVLERPGAGGLGELGGEPGRSGVGCGAWIGSVWSCGGQVSKKWCKVSIGRVAVWERPGAGGQEELGGKPGRVGSGRGVLCVACAVVVLRCSIWSTSMKLV